MAIIFEPGVVQAGRLVRPLPTQQESLQETIQSNRVNHSLHTAWLENHALTLKRNAQNIIFCENYNFCIPSKKFVVNQGNLSKVQKSSLL